MVQQFIVGTEIAKVLGKLKDAGKFASLTKKLSDGATAVGKTVKNTADVAKGAIKKFTRGAGEAANRFLERFGLKRSDEFADSLTHCVIRMGAQNSCNRPDWHKLFGDANIDAMLKRSKLRRQSGLDDFSLERQVHALQRHVDGYPPPPGMTKGSSSPGTGQTRRYLTPSAMRPTTALGMLSET
jgi:hypothetical protein